MEEKELFNYGDKELNVNSLLKYIDSNQLSYLDFYSSSISDANAFIEKVNYIKEGIKNGTITTDGTGVYTDASGKILETDELMSNALHYVDIIAKELSKKSRALTLSEIAQREKDKDLKKIELERKKIEESKLQEKPKFEPESGWSVAKAFAHSFNNNGLIPYEVLQQLITVGEDGKEIYTDLHTLLNKNFDKVSKLLQAFNDTESYITNINAFKKALIDGNLSPQDRLLGMELGFQSSELDKLSNLISYKINQKDPAVTTETIEEPLDTILNNPELLQQPLERDDLYLERVKRYYASVQKDRDFVNQAMNYINWELFDSPKFIKSDSEEEFKNFLVSYINSKLLASMDRNFVNRYPVTPYGGYGTPELITKFTNEHLQYIDPKIYNMLGLKFFSKYTTTDMYKYFKELVEKQNKEQVQANKEGGIIKAQGGVKVPIKLDFGSLDYYGINELTDFSLYDAKQMAEVLNSIPVDLHTFNGEPADNIDFKRKAIADFITRLKTAGDISTGNGTLTYNTANNRWEHSGWVDKSALSTVSDSDPEDVSVVSDDPETNNEKTTTSGTKKAPKVADLTLKLLKFKKSLDLNPDGIINSLSGYVANAAANAKKHEILKDIPIYLEISTPEKGFRTAYTYDLEKAKNEIMAEATNLLPVTSDVNAYYAAKNDAIKNARNYTTKLDTEINERIHQTAKDNLDITFENAVNRTNNTNTNAKYRHDWEVELKQGEVDYMEANNQSFLNLNKEIKHSLVTASRQKKKQRDAYTYKHIVKGIMTTPSNYIDGWTKYHDLIWYKGQNNLLENDEERTMFQQLSSVVQQAVQSIMALYEGIKYEGIGELHIPQGLMAEYTPKVSTGARGMKISKLRMCNFINKVK